MSFGNPFDADRALGKGACSCGAHDSQMEHDAAVDGSAEARLVRVVESAVVRALFPEDRARSTAPNTKNRRSSPAV
jgi:nitrate/nitrite transport system substrate-binding protein